jgi:hypothetical protein
MNLISLATQALHAVGAVFLTIGVSISGFFGYAPAVDATTPSSATGTSIVASSSTVPAYTLSGTQAFGKPVDALTHTLTTTAPLPAPRPVAPPKRIEPKTLPAESKGTVGTTTLAIQKIPLLRGGIVRAGTSVALSYLQITNVGVEGALLKGFWVKQNGSAPGESIKSLSTVDDKGGSRGSAGGTETTTLFKDGIAFAPTDAFFAPGQMRLFTIKATLARDVTAYVGMQLMIDVSSVDTMAAVQGEFPIRGTTWTIAL